MSLSTWIGQEGPSAEKHTQWTHPLVALMVHYTIASIITFGIHDAFMDANDCVLDKADSTLTREAVALGVTVYAVWLLLWRLYHANNDHRPGIVYEYTWLCNVTLLLGAAALWTNRPLMATAHCVAVGIDQLMWYVDLLGWTLSGFTKFPIGVAKYITWPGTSFSTRITCTHHLWTIPLFISCAKGIHPATFPLSVVIVVTNVALSRWLTPFCIPTKYLNVNLSYELWKDVKLDLLQINYDDPPLDVYLFRLLWRWALAFNFLVFGVLYTVSYQIFGQAPTC